MDNAARAGKHITRHPVPTVSRSVPVPCAEQVRRLLTRLAPTNPNESPSDVNPRSLFALVLVGALTACGPKADPRAGVPVPGSESPELAATLTDLTHAVRRYATEKQKIPASLDEVVAAGYIQRLPEPPPGQKLALHPRRLEVVLERK